MSDCTVLADSESGGLGEITILHPKGTFAPTPATRISLQAIGQHQRLLEGVGMDWGSGAGCLAIAAAKIAAVREVVGLEISKANVEIARENARRNGVAGKTEFLLANSYSPVFEEDRERLEDLSGRINFLLANPPASDGDDGFGFRRIVLRGARKFLSDGGIIFLSVSYQYGPDRIQQLAVEIPGFEYAGVLASTDWVPFDLARPDLLHCLELYAAEEARAGPKYTFESPQAAASAGMDARSALAHFRATGESPRSKWQTLLFRYRPR